MTKIKNKLLLAFIFISLIPLLGLGGYALTSISDSLEESSIAKLNDKVNLVSLDIENFLKNVSNDLFYLRDSVAIQSMINTPGTLTEEERNRLIKNLEHDFLAFSKNKKIYHQIRFLDISGMEVVRVDYNNGRSVVVPKQKLQNKQKRYYFADTAKLPVGKLMISPLDLNRERGKVEQPLRPVIRYGTPIYDKDRELQGIVLFNVLAEKFLKTIKKNNTGNEQLLFVNNDGFYYSHPDSRKEWGGKADLNTGENLKKDYPSLENKILGADIPRTILQKENLVASAPVFLDRNKELILGTIIDIVPTQDIFMSATKFRNIFLLISGCALLIVIFMGIWLARTITDPIVYLTQATEAMSKGKLKASVSVDSRDETKQLAESVERLRKSLLILMKRK